MMATTEPTTVMIAGAPWRVLFTLHAVRKIEERYSPVGDWMESGLQGFLEAQERLAAGDIDALAAFLWAGLLHESPATTFEDVLDLLDEAGPAELAVLPGRLLEALHQCVGRPSRKSGRGEPWSWPVALAVWVSEWGRSEAEFWQATFRTVAAISDGRAQLYDAARKGTASASAPADGYSLFDLLTLKGR